MVISFQKSYNVTEKYIEKHPDIIFTPADKGNTTVVVNKLDPKNKFETMLSYKKIYNPCTLNPIEDLVDKLTNVKNRWVQKGFINKFTLYKHFDSAGNLARAYDLPKIYKLNETNKKGIPNRLIIPLIGSPLHKFAEYIDSIMKCKLPVSDTNVKISLDFTEKIKNIVLPKDYVLVSFEVVSMFTNISRKQFQIV